MAVSFYCGSPGSGKSYHVVKEVIIPGLEQGRSVLTNLPLDVEQIKKSYPKMVSHIESGGLELLDDTKESRAIMKAIHNKVDCSEYAGWLIVLDEVHKYYPSHTAIKDEAFIEWYSEHRHKYQDLVFITQDFFNVNKFVRSLTEKRYEFSKNADKGFSNSYNQDFYLGVCKKAIDRTIRVYDKTFFKFYHSYDLGLPGRGFVEKQVGKKMNLLFKPLLIAGVSISIVLFCGFLAFRNILGSDVSAGETVSSAGIGKNETIIQNPEGKGSTPLLKSVKKVPGQPVSVKYGVFPQKGVRGKGSGSFGLNCHTAMMAGIGAGESKGMRVYSSGGAVRYIRGNFKVVGIIGIGSKRIHLFKDESNRLTKGVIPGRGFNVGDKVCF